MITDFPRAVAGVESANSFHVIVCYLFSEPEAPRHDGPARILPGVGRGVFGNDIVGDVAPRDRSAETIRPSSMQIIFAGAFNAIRIEWENNCMQKLPIKAGGEGKRDTYDTFRFSL